ncbi:MAG: hypothetical protein GX876_00470 [Bacteroidales bacterium]|nr:hypothetical protein [Bacteroidales bacterium]
MKTQAISAALAIIILVMAGCRGGGSGKEVSAANDTISVPDTGYTGIKQYTSGNRIIREVSFKNGVRHGLTKTFYPGGQVYQTFWYDNGLRQDSGRYYYVEGQLFRTTPYRNDTMNGIQKQYYRTGQLKARIGYDMGMRTPFLEEYNHRGLLIREYPEIVAAISDEYRTRGLYRITLELSDRDNRVKFNIGEFTDGRFDTAYIKPVNTTDGRAVINLKKSGQAGKDYLGIIAEITTPFGNRNLVFKRIELPYNDLN